MKAPIDPLDILMDAENLMNAEEPRIRRTLSERNPQDLFYRGLDVLRHAIEYVNEHERP